MTVTASTPTATTSTSAAPAGRGRRIAGRAVGVVAAVAVTYLAWGIGALVGADYWITDGMGSVRIDLVVTAQVTVILALAGWALLALLERITRRGGSIRTAVAVAVTAASLVPIFLVDATTTTRIGLVLVHLAVGATLIPAYLRAAR
jgi:fermentation-respiration switch protein FrsA (DUF1100 family)